MFTYKLLSEISAFNNYSRRFSKLNSYSSEKVLFDPHGVNIEMDSPVNQILLFDMIGFLVVKTNFTILMGI